MKVGDGSSASAPQGLRSLSSDVYLPLPNHNYVSTGKTNLKAAPTKSKYYQIKKPSSKYFIKEPKMANSVLR